MRIVNCQLRIANCQLQTANCQLAIAHLLCLTALLTFNWPLQPDEVRTLQDGEVLTTYHTNWLMLAYNIGSYTLLAALTHGFGGAVIKKDWKSFWILSLTALAAFGTTLQINWI